MKLAEYRELIESAEAGNVAGIPETIAIHLYILKAQLESACWSTAALKTEALGLAGRCKTLIAKIDSVSHA